MDNVLVFSSTPRKTLKNLHQGGIHSIRFNSNGNYLLSGGQDRKINLSNAETGAHIKTYSLHAYEVLDIAIVSDSSMV